MRDYLTKMRDDAYINIKTGYSDTGASPNKRVLPISYSAYTPPSAKKKRKVERTRFRETSRGFRQKTEPAVLTAEKPAEKPVEKKNEKKSKKQEQASLKPGKKEKIRFGKAPQETLPNSPSAVTEDAGAVPAEQAASADEPANPLEAAPERKKTRFSDRAREPKRPKKGVVQQQEKDAMAPTPADAAEVADRQTQSAPLGLNGDTTKKKKKGTSTGEKTRITDRPKTPADEKKPLEPTPVPPVQGAPGATTTPAPPSTAPPASQPAPPAPQQ